MENELTSKVPAEPAAADSSVGGKVAGMATGAAATATAAFTGAAAYFSSGKATGDAKTQLPESTHAAVDKVAGGDSTAATAVSSTLPDTVKESIADSKQSPEAAANTTAVEEKAQVESELLKQVKKEDTAGEPAPTITAATTDSAPKSTEEPLPSDKKPNPRLAEKPIADKSTEEPLSADAAAFAAAAASSSTDSPKEPSKEASALKEPSKEASAPKDVGNGKAPATSSETPKPAPAAADTTITSKDTTTTSKSPATPKPALDTTGRDASRDLSPMSRPGESSAAASPRTVGSTDSQGNKRHSGFFRRLKEKIEHRRHKDKDASA